MKNLTKTSLLSIFLFTVLFQFACNQEKPADLNKELINSVTLINSEVKEDIIVEEIIDDLLLDLEQYEFKKTVSDCPSITIEKIEDEKYTRIITKDFGEGCTNQWGIEKSGKIIIEANGKWLDEGSKRIVHFENYTHRGISVDGIKRIICNGLNEDSLYMHTISGELKLVRPDSVIVHRELQKKRIILSGAHNPDLPKEWLISGHAKVEKSNGRTYHVNTNNLYRIQGCKWPQMGTKVLHITANENKEIKTDHKITIDYSYSESDDACDSFALRQVDKEEPVVIKLK